MSRLERAMERFSSALDKLEARLNRHSFEAPQANGEIESLRADHARMSHELDQLKSERRALEDVTDEVAGRLDGAIREIRSVLEP